MSFASTRGARRFRKLTGKTRPAPVVGAIPDDLRRQLLQLTVDKELMRKVLARIERWRWPAGTLKDTVEATVDHLRSAMARRDALKKSLDSTDEREQKKAQFRRKLLAALAMGDELIRGASITSTLFKQCGLDPDDIFEAEVVGWPEPSASTRNWVSEWQAASAALRRLVQDPDEWVLGRQTPRDIVRGSRRRGAPKQPWLTITRDLLGDG